MEGRGALGVIASEQYAEYGFPGRRLLCGLPILLVYHNKGNETEVWGTPRYGREMSKSGEAI